MTGRDRIIGALQKKETDQVPWTPCLEGYYLSGLGKESNQVDAVREVGADVFARHVWTYRTAMEPVSTAQVEREAGWNPPRGSDKVVHEVSRRGDIEVVTEVKDGHVTQTTITPVGELRCRWVYNEHATYIPFPVEHRVKTPEDLKVLRYEVEHLEYEPCYEFFTEMDAAIGESGIATTTSPACPFHLLLEDEIGLENFYYLLSDAPTEMEELMEIMHERHKEIYAIVAASPAWVSIDYENTSTTMMSPAMYEKYNEKQIGDYTEILHRSGKLLLAHMCGTLKGLEKQLARTHLDGIVDIAPKPTGDISLLEAARLWAPDKIVMGGIDATAFTGLTPTAMEAHAAAILDEVAGLRGVFLGSGDAIPKGTRPENLMAVSRAVKAARR